MPTSVLATLREQREALVGEIEGLLSADDFDPADQTITEARGRAETLDNRIKALVEWEQQRTAANAIDAIQVNARQVREKTERQVDSGLSPGQIWTRSKQFQDYMQAPRGTSGRLTLDLDQMQIRAPILTTTWTGVLPKERIAPSTPPQSQTPLLDNMSRVRVTSNSVEWVTYPAAAPVAGVVAEGSAKPEATLTPSLVTVSLDTIAHWVTVSRQFLEDAGAVADWVDAALRRGVVDKTEAQAAAALVAASVPTVGTGTDPLMENIRIAVGAVQTAGYMPQVALLNPADWAALDIGVFSTTMFGPVMTPQYWGVRPIGVGAIPSGTAYVGDLRTAMTLLERNEVQVYTTDSHASNFISNLFVILAEARNKAVVTQPSALVKTTGTVTAALRGGGSSEPVGAKTK